MKALESRTSFLRTHSTLALVALLATTIFAQAGGYHGHYWGHGGWGYRPGVSFYFGSPYYAAPVYAYSPAYVPVYPSGYAYPRPNYAVGGTLLGALAGGLIGDSVHHQGWEGAAIGAASGLLLGGLAEHQVRKQEQKVFSTPAYATPNAPAPVVTRPPVPATAPASAPASPPAPTVSNSSVSRATSSSDMMSSANALFGR